VSTAHSSQLRQETAAGRVLGEWEGRGGEWQTDRRTPGGAIRRAVATVTVMSPGGMCSVGHRPPQPSSCSSASKQRAVQHSPCTVTMCGAIISARAGQGRPACGEQRAASEQASSSGSGSHLPECKRRTQCASGEKRVHGFGHAAGMLIAAARCSVATGAAHATAGRDDCLEV
jgi:hypothetical protein